MTKEVKTRKTRTPKEPIHTSITAEVNEDGKIEMNEELKEFGVTPEMVESANKQDLSKNTMHTMDKAILEAAKKPGKVKGPKNYTVTKRFSSGVNNRIINAEVGDVLKLSTTESRLFKEFIEE